jgi:uncharacterized membrane protein (UPF0127 family)
MVAVACLTLVACDTTRATDTTTQPVTINGHAFELELALDTAARTQGLSDRESIAVDGGMLFVFADAEVREFWMYHCLVPIDIVFLGPGGRIVAMHRMTVESADTDEEDLRRYSSRYPAQFALEFAGGTLDKLDLKEGQMIDLPVADLKRQAK